MACTASRASRSAPRRCLKRLGDALGGAFRGQSGYGFDYRVELNDELIELCNDGEGVQMGCSFLQCSVVVVECIPIAADGIEGIGELLQRPPFSGFGGCFQLLPQFQCHVFHVPLGSGGIGAPLFNAFEQGDVVGLPAVPQLAERGLLVLGGCDHYVGKLPGDSGPGEVAGLCGHGREACGKALQGLMHRASVAGDKTGAPFVKVLVESVPFLIDGLPLVRESVHGHPVASRQRLGGLAGWRIRERRLRSWFGGLAAGDQRSQQQ